MKRPSAPEAAAALRDEMGVGEHCAFAECAQLDFLPFTCSGCADTFCLEHRACGVHRCAHAGARRQRARGGACRVSRLALQERLSGGCRSLLLTR